ncbi:hypothetical protein HY389_01720 [Candidatus Daviesbacteria bacterium]|nr:hypothetical protein [Candidatus Daviesbacteria bacterium]
MELKDLVLIATGIFDIFLGLAILLRNKGNQINLSFAFFSFSLAGWAIGIAMFRLNTDTELALYWAKFYYIAASFIAATLLYFATIFPEGQILSLRKKLLIVVPAVVHAALISIPGYLTKSIVNQSWGKEVVLGRVEYAIYTIYFLPFFYGALYLLWAKYRKATGNNRKNILFVLVSVLLASLFGVFFNLLLPWLGNYQLIYLGPPFTMIIFWILMYGIFKHHLWDFRLVFVRVVTYSVLVFIIAGVYTAALFFLSSALLGFIPNQVQPFLGGLYALFIALTFQPMRQAIESITERYLYRGRYDSDQLLSNLGHIMSSTIDLNQLTSQILQIILSQVKITRGAFVLLEKNSIYTVISSGFGNKSTFSYQQINQLLVKDEIVIFDDLPEGEIKQLMRELNFSVSKTLKVESGVIGLLVLGEKASGEIYSDQDIKLLTILAPEVAVAIQNAQSFDKIKKFNITLTQEVQKATADLKQANIRLKDLDRLKDDFVSVASHELRTPMTAIKSYLWMAINRGDIELTEKMTRYLSRAYVSTERLINLVNDMLNVSRIESGRIEIKLVPFNIVDLALDAVADVNAKAAEKMITTDVVKVSLPMVFADPDKVRQVLLNLLGNALKFTPVDGRISINFLTDGQSVEVKVTDTGAGISKDDMSRLFQKFGRLDNSYVAAATSGGTGLGLYISKSLIDLMHGKIWARSEGLGKGSTFSFELPIATKEILVQAGRYVKATQGEAKGLEPVAI